MITPRLEMILHHIKGKTCADIGTDHAYIPIKLWEKGIKTIATDIRPGPLETARRHTEKYGADIELRLGSGLSPINAGEAETVIIAGMGGEMIENIIRSGLEKAKSCRLILQPMNSQDTLRRFLLENGFRIICEDLACEGFKVYNLIVAEAGEAEKYEREIDLHLPKILYSHTLFTKLCDKKIRELTKIVKGLEKAQDADKAELERLSRLLEEAKKIREETK